MTLLTHDSIKASLTTAKLRAWIRSRLPRRRAERAAELRRFLKELETQYELRREGP